jgi:hypothetical protein
MKFIFEILVIVTNYLNSCWTKLNVLLFIIIILKMKNKLLLYFVVLLLSNSIFSSTIKRSQTYDDQELDDYIEYLSKNNAHQNNFIKEVGDYKFQQKDDNENNEISLLELRGLGCESFNKCSGKGTCKNGVCTCDEGFDYFDCSQDKSRIN